MRERIVFKKKEIIVTELATLMISTKKAKKL